MKKNNSEYRGFALVSMGDPVQDFVLERHPLTTERRVIRGLFGSQKEDRARAKKTVRVRKVERENTHMMLEKLKSLDPNNWQRYAKNAEALFGFLHVEATKKHWKFIDNFMCSAMRGKINEHAMLFLLDAMYEHRSNLKSWESMLKNYKEVSNEPFSFEGR